MTYYFPAEANDYIKGKIKKPVKSENKAKKIKLDNPKPYIGTYKVAPGTDLVISNKEGMLMLQPPGQGPVGIDAFDNGTFGIPLAGAVIEFEGDPTTGITGLIMTQGSSKTHATKK